MARALRITFPGAFFHITSRGNERKVVFKSKRDRDKFFEYLESATLQYDVPREKGVKSWFVIIYNRLITDQDLTPAFAICKKKSVGEKGVASWFVNGYTVSFLLS